MTFRSSKLLASANGQPCMHCGAHGTTIAAHANSVALGKGTGIKVPDYFTAWLCQQCHDLYDGRTGRLSKQEKEEFWVRAFLKTVAQWFLQGIVKVS